jgi:hypothetical protein
LFNLLLWNGFNNITQPPPPLLMPLSIGIHNDVINTDCE